MLCGKNKHNNEVQLAKLHDSMHVGMIILQFSMCFRLIFLEHKIINGTQQLSSVNQVNHTNEIHDVIM